MTDDLPADEGALGTQGASEERVRRMTQQLRDLEERLRRSEELLRHAQKLEALGSLAAGVAHDFNNSLCVILFTADAMLEKLAVSDPLRTAVKDIHDAGVSAGALTRQLLAFSRRRTGEGQVVDPNAMLDGVERMLLRLLGGDVTLTVLRGRIGAVRIDAGQFEHLVTNLVVNARDAMPRGGRITLETREADVDEAYAASVGAKPGVYVVLAVSDTGAGMDEATKACIFEPFFTTKEPGRGTGLGLAMVREIVDQSGGFIDVRSAPRKGTTFSIHLPRVASEPLPIRALPAVDPSLCGDETILLVEDDDHARAAMRTVLVRRGYDVLEARNAGEALLIDEQVEGAIDLLVTDVILPRMSGPALAARLAPLRPHLRVIFISGGEEDENEHRSAAAGHSAFLAKPITPVALLEKVRDLLGPSSRAHERR